MTVKRAGCADLGEDRGEVERVWWGMEKQR
jgi:hypothetical protein